MANWVFVRPETEIQTIKNDCVQYPEQTIFPIVSSSDDTYQGYITAKEIDSCSTGTAEDCLTSIGDVTKRRNTFVYDSESLETAKRKLRDVQIQILPVVDSARHFRGTIDKDST